MALAPARAALRLKAGLKFPARVLAGAGLAISRANGVFSFALNFPALVDNSGVSDPSKYTTAVFNKNTGGYEELRLDQLPTPTETTTRTPRGDGNYSILNTDRFVALTAALTAARTWTLPAASAVPGGRLMVIQDEVAGISGTNTITLAPTGSDTINGASSFVLATTRGGVELRSDGTSKWSVRVLADASVGTEKIADGAVATAKLADSGVTNAKLANMAAGTVKANVTGAAAAPTDVLISSLVLGLPRAYSEYAVNAGLTTVIPIDDTIPQVSEGSQILAASVTPRSMTSRVRARFRGFFSPNANSLTGVGALFLNGAANAVRTTAVTCTAANGVYEMALEYEFVPSSTSAQAFTVRVGPGSSGQINFNGTTTGRLFGGTAAATLIVEELL